MRHNLSLILAVTALLTLVSSRAVFSQDDTNTVSATIEEMAEAGAPIEEPDVQWLWGEVISIDFQKNELAVKYLDYEIDQEKEITIAIDPGTTYENVESFGQIKPKDTVSIDYIVNPVGKNIAKNISVEKPEAVNLEPQDLEASGEGTAGETQIEPIAPIEETVEPAANTANATE